MTETSKDKDLKDASAANAALTVGADEDNAAVDIAADEANAQKKKIAIVGMVVAVAIILISCFFLFGGADQKPTASTSETSVEQNVAPTQNAQSAKKAESAAEAEKTEGEAEATAASDGTQGGSDDTASSQAANKNQNSSNSSHADASQDDSSAGGSSQGDSSSSGSTDAVVPPAPEPNTVTVSVVVSSAVVGNPVSTSQTVVLNRDATVYDALLATGLSINATRTNMGIYIAAIGGLAEKQHGGMSGWTYYVNGVWADRSCGFWTVQDGDQIYWEYVTGVDGW